MKILAATFAVTAILFIAHNVVNGNAWEIIKRLHSS